MQTPTTITVRDELASGEITNQIEFSIPAEQITVRELIRSRVFQEVKDHNLRKAGDPGTPYNGLVHPTDTESRLNGKRGKPQIDWQRQFERAVEAFERNQILILVDDRQLEALDEEITLGPASSISFLRLTPLAGG